MEKEIIIGVLQMSDRASVDTNAYSSLSGDAIIAVLTSYIKSPFRTIFNIIPDEYDLIIQSFHTLAVTEKCCLILTTGGTGPAKRDVTVEATEAFCQKILPGFGELMRMESLKYVPTAILSRQTAGIFENTLIVNLPGKPAAIAQCLQAVFPAIPYCIDLIDGPFIAANEANIKVFRPISG
ncbi:MAG: molybdopterin adenylyltransferase [Bacteroidetes bacterium]|nr:molybdopterin adenylyltransferase [Bacteroidota bacterium]